MKYISSAIVSLSLLIFSTSCTDTGSDNDAGEQAEMADKEKADDAADDLKKYKVYKAPESHHYPDASLSMESPSEEMVQPGEVEFDYTVTNFELKQQTPDAKERGIANSDNGQHIHFIVNNGPYSAQYESSFTKKMEEGHYVILSFLSRSYHESVKNGNAHTVKQLTVGDPKDKKEFNPNAEHLFYSRPKGTYSGKDTEKLMLDFFLMNTAISENGNKVRATINGEEHMITEWAPHYIEGLGKGEMKITLELLDASGNLIPGPFNKVERTVTLK